MKALLIRSIRSRAALAAALTVGAGLGLAACSTTQTPDARVAATPLDQFPQRITQSQDETALAVHLDGISSAQAVALNQAVSRWRDGGGQAIVIRTPRGVNDGASYAMAEAVRGFLTSAGVPMERIRMEGYDSAGSAAAPLVVAFSSLEAAVPQCGTHWGNLTATFNNVNSGNFGCAISANLAAMAANPADLAHMRASDPTDAARRQTVLEKYRAGEKTSADDGGVTGAVSQAIK